MNAQFADLYRDHSGSLIRHLSRCTGCSELGRELAHEAFVRLLRLGPFFLTQIERPDAYLRRISTNLLRDWGRARARHDNFWSSSKPLELDHVDQVATLESRDTLRRLERAMAKLKPRTRDIFLAHRLDGRSYAQIAADTGLTVKGVEKQMSKAIAAIDRALDRG